MRRLRLTGSTPDALWSSPSAGLLRPTAVACSGLRRTIGRDRLLDGVDLAIPRGARVLVYGQPERSASLLLRVLAGLVAVDGGTMELAGEPDPVRRARRIAYVAPDAGVYPWLTPREALDLAGRLAGLGRVERAERIDVAAEWFRLTAILDRSMRRAGPAVTQLTALAAAMIGEPEVLLLDEPLRAVDADERRRLLRIDGARRTVLLASRFPATEAGIVDRVVLLRAGRVAADLTLSDLAARGLDLSAQGLSALVERERSLRGLLGALLR